MTPIRSLFAGICSLAVAGPSLAAGPCLKTSEQSAFDLHSLQSALMVAALTCRQEDAYNGFVVRFRSELGGAYRAVATHFRKTGGGTRKLDEYITNLANAHSQTSIAQGSAFCARTAPVWPTVMALRPGGELSRFSGTQTLPVVHAVAACPVEPARSRTLRPTQSPAAGTLTAAR